MPELCPISHKCFQGTRLWILYHQQFKRFPFAGWWHILLLPASQESEKARDRFKALDGRNSSRFLWFRVKMYIFQHLGNDKDRRGRSLLSALVEASVLHLLH